MWRICVSSADVYKRQPLYKLENISRQFGKNIYIKRDDMIGVALGGNKVRKLEYLLADARDQGVDVVLTAGGPQSNHAMLTAVSYTHLDVYKRQARRDMVPP